MRPNRLKDIWMKGRKATNCWLSIPSPLTAEMLAHQGWDSLTIDMQHGAVDYAAMLAMLAAVSASEAVPIVRVSENRSGEIGRALDAGATGVMCPTVNTADEAARFVAACRYAPAGVRSVGPLRAALYAGADYVARANDTVLAIAQIETATALAHVNEIARVPGLDMLFVGPNDLGLSMGRVATSDQTDPVVVEAIDAVLAAARMAGIHAGIYCRAPEYGATMMKKGFDLVTVVGDLGLLSTGAELRRKFD